ncbi:helix-turn-helix domain-containing protein [Acidobacteria bacterium AH-259-L09]|nr:helix-turn-helix domain-containing protein [Acidobacteria bacterium AH-259-L09]
MTGMQLRKARKGKGWSQQQAAARLGVSQPYLSLLERRHRRLTRRLVARATRVFGLPLTSLPLKPAGLQPQTPQRVAEELSALGYPGFAYMQTKRRRNPAEVLVGALKQDNLEARLAEALPWVLLNYSDLDWKWLLDQARLHNLQNRLGFLVTLARTKLEEKGELQSRRYRNLRYAQEELESSRLAHEDALGEATLTAREREWLREHRPKLAARWNLLSDLSPEHLPYAL